jgi:hypothetical protein
VGMGSRVEKWPKQCMHMWINEQKNFLKIKFLVFFPFPIPPTCGLHLVCDPCVIISQCLHYVYNLHMTENMWFLAFSVWLTLLKVMFSSFTIYLRMTKFHSLWLNKIPLCINTTFS